MKLEIIRNNEIVNTFDDAVTSLINNIWAHDQKLGTVKKMIVQPNYNGYVNISFELVSGSPDKLIYKFCDVPYCGGTVNFEALMNNGRITEYYKTDTDKNGNTYYLTVDHENKEFHRYHYYFGDKYERIGRRYYSRLIKQLQAAGYKEVTR